MVFFFFNLDSHGCDIDVPQVAAPKTSKIETCISLKVLRQF